MFLNRTQEKNNIVYKAVIEGRGVFVTHIRNILWSLAMAVVSLPPRHELIDLSVDERRYLPSANNRSLSENMFLVRQTLDSLFGDTSIMTLSLVISDQ